MSFDQRLFFTAAAILIVLFAGVCGEEEAGLEGNDSSGLKVETEQLKSKIHALELEKSKIALDLKYKDVIIFEKDGVIREKSDKVALLESELVAIKGQGASDAEEKVAKVEARVSELEKLIAGLEAKIGKQKKAKDAAEAKVVGSETRNNELTSKINELQKTLDLKQAEIKKTERALKAAEDEIARITSEAVSKVEKLLEAHGAWLPPWLAAHVDRYQAHWNEHGKPVIDSAFQKAVEKIAKVQKWAEPHIEVLHTNWVPAIKEYWLLIVARVEPHLKSVKVNSIKAFEASKEVVTPHIIKLHEHVDPYYQEAKRITKPYIEHVASVSRPHVEKVTLALKPYAEGVVKIYGRFLQSATTHHSQEAKRVAKPYIEHVASVSRPHVEKVTLALKPYAEGVVKLYGRFLQSATTYHSQVQVHVQETLKKHEWTKPFATREFEWFAASALLALPVMILFRIFSTACSKKAKKPSNHPHHHGRRKAKRGHSS